MKLPTVHDIIEFTHPDDEVCVIFEFYGDLVGMMRVVDDRIELEGLTQGKRGGWFMAGQEPDTIPIGAFMEMADKVREMPTFDTSTETGREAILQSFWSAYDEKKETDQ